MRNDFCIFILTHGRADHVYTYNKLAEFKYTGRIYIVIDDEDKQRQAYLDRFGDKVLIFSKQDIADRFDEGDNFSDRRAVFYARNACFDLARKIGVRYFMEMDDDYSGWYFRLAKGPTDSVARRAECLDIILEKMIEYFRTIPALSIAMSQGGDHIGGIGANHPKRKAMNTLLCDVERPFAFMGRINEDVNTYTQLSRRGESFLTFYCIQVNQKQTQSNPGGMTELCLNSGTYIKSFYSVMYTPSAVKIRLFKDKRSEGDKTSRLHHSINWKNCASQIIPERFRKP